MYHRFFSAFENTSYWERKTQYNKLKTGAAIRLSKTVK